jgi:hypothetical protein
MGHYTWFIVTCNELPLQGVRIWYFACLVCQSRIGGEVKTTCFQDAMSGPCSGRRQLRLTGHHQVHGLQYSIMIARYMVSLCLASICLRLCSDLLVFAHLMWLVAWLSCLPCHTWCNIIIIIIMHDCLGVRNVDTALRHQLKKQHKLLMDCLRTHMPLLFAPPEPGTVGGGAYVNCCW